MDLRPNARLILAVAAVVLSATATKSAHSQPAPADISLTGQLLIATPAMGDPRFSGTVILLVKHDREGAFGIVINRRVGEARMRSIPGAADTETDRTLPIFYGGPVQPDQGFMVHSAEYRRTATVAIDGRVALTASPEVLRDIANGQGPQKMLLAFGYSGWAPGQLEGELKMQAWVTAPADLQLIFDDDREKVWDNAMARRGRDI
jgi:putative transcriptional regulator